MLFSAQGQPSHFLQPWRDFFTAATDAPLTFGEAAGLMCLSNIAIGRRTVDVGSGVIPNLFMMLVGGSSIARKSTSVRFAEDALKLVDPARIGPSDYTMEALLKWMTTKDPSNGIERNRVALFSEEFGQDLARMDAYNASFQTDFCALYDGKTFEKIRQKSAPLLVDKPRVNVFAAAAYPMLRKYLSTDDWMSGYLMRFLYVAPLAHGRVQFLMQPPFPKAKWDAAIYGLSTIWSTIEAKHAKMAIEPSAQQVYEAAQASLLRWAQNKSHITITYTSRFGINVLKLAALYQLDIDPWADIGDWAMTQAITFAGDVCWPSFEAVKGETIYDDWQACFDGVLELLRMNRVVTIGALYKQFSGMQRLPEILKYLVGGQVVHPSLTDKGEQALRLDPKWANVATA